MSIELQVSDVHHRFGELIALDGVSFAVGGGEIVGLVGRNGAGKTTTMRSVMGIVHPDRGAVQWSGQDVAQGDRLRFGYMPEERGLYSKMRIGDQLEYLAVRFRARARAARQENVSLATDLAAAVRQTGRQTPDLDALLSRR